MMIFFQFHIGDWESKTRLLSPVEKGVYLDLLTFYYTTEGPIIRANYERITRVYSEEEKSAADYVLSTFFEEKDGAYYNKRCDEEIAAWQEKSQKAKKSIKTRWERERAKKTKPVLRTSDTSGVPTRKDTPLDTNVCTDEILTINHKPLTINIDNHNNNQSTVCNEGSFEKAVDGDDCSFDPDEIVDAPVAVQAAQAQLEYFEQLADDKPLTLPQLITGCKSFGIKLAHTPKTEAIANRATVTKEVLRECVRVWKGKKVGTGYFVAILDNASRDDGTVAPKQAMPNASEPWNDPNYYNDFGESGVLK